jgi:transposase
MDKKLLLTQIQIDPSEWEQTPPGVKKTMERLWRELEELKIALKQAQEKAGMAEEKIQRNSENSHSPPSQDPPQVKRKKSKSSKRKRGGQSGHQGQSRILYPESECDKIEDHYPEICACCGEQLQGIDEKPYRHQIVEIPEIALSITEHRLHQLSCSNCGGQTRAKLPEQVESTGYGVRVVSIVALLSGMYRHSHRMVKTAMEDLFGVRMSLGTISRIRTEMSEALAVPVTAAKEYVQQGEIVNVDETGFAQGNSDGQNPQKRKAWLWVVVTTMVTFFEVTLSRSTEAAREILGANFLGLLISDRYSAYNWIDLKQRQLCWAHLKREFTKISERTGVARQIGRDLLAQEKRLFRLWQKVRDGTLRYPEFQHRVPKIRTRVQNILSEAAAIAIGPKEKTPLAKTVRTCRQLLKVEPALWLFTTSAGVEPTNNAAERAIRPAVIWRRTSFGSQSEAGSIFMARMLTVVTSLRSQKRNVLSFLTAAVEAARHQTQPPSLLPESPTETELEKLAA